MRLHNLTGCGICATCVEDALGAAQTPLLDCSLCALPRLEIGFKQLFGHAQGEKALLVGSQHTQCHSTLPSANRQKQHKQTIEWSLVVLSASIRQRAIWRQVCQTPQAWLDITSCL